MSAFKKMLTMLLAVMMTCSLVGCEVFREGCHNFVFSIFERGYFVCREVGKRGQGKTLLEENVIAIIGLTESGAKQEVLEIPRVIDGKEVWFLGGRKPLEGGLAHAFYYWIESDNLKKVYIHDNIRVIAPEAFNHKGYRPEADTSVRVIVNSFEPISISFHTAGFFIYRLLYDDVVGKDDPSSPFKYNTWNSLPANIAFMYNFAQGNQDYYRPDHIYPGEKVPVPPNPKRKGYSFAGWYREPTCENAWDFDVVPTLADDEELKLFAKWQ